MRTVCGVLTLILFAAAMGVSEEAHQKANSSAARNDAVRALDDSAANLSELARIHANTVQLSEKMSAIYSALDKKISELGKLAQKPDSASQLVQAVKQMQETQMSFNLQYLQLQNSMQDENRQFTMVSNIMKTKHDTVKNSISNIR